MAVVYDAWDVRQKRSVAVKLIRPELVSQALTERFEREIAIAAQLVHPHIVPVFDAGAEGKTLYFVMPLLTGGTLRDRIAKYGPLAVSEVRRLAEQMASALHFAHQRDCIHRDVKPENVLMSEGAAMLADFGIARSDDFGTGLAATSGFLGTPTYASPEQLLATGPVGPPSDQYSLACVLFEALAGRAPFVGSGVADVVVAHTTEPAPLLSSIRPDVPPPMVAAIARALSKHPQDRFATVAEFGEAFAATAGDAFAAERGRRGSRRRVAGLLLGVVAAAALYYGGAFSSRAGDDGPRVVAVLPCRNLSGDPGQEYFSDGVTEQVITQLSTLPDVRVINMISMLQFKNTAKSVQEIGRELEADLIVYCSAFRQREGVRIGAQLVEVSTGDELWTREHFDESQEVLRPQLDASVSIAEAMRLTLSDEGRRRITTLATENDSAYALWARGKRDWNLGTGDGLLRSRDYFSLAAALDSSFALAWVGLADAHLSFVGRLMAAGPPNYAVAEQAARKALAVDPALGEALAARGRLHHRADWNFKAARADFNAARRASPSSWQLWLDQAKLLSVQARHDDAIEFARRAQQLDPMNAINVLGLAEILYFARRYDEALKETDRAIELEPTFAFNHLWRAMILIGMARPEDAVLAAQEASRLAGNHPGTLAILARAEAESGRPELARAILADMERLPAGLYVPPTLEAVVYMGLQETDLAVAALTRAVQARDWFITELAVHPLADSVRDDPRVQALLVRMGLDRVSRPMVTPAGAATAFED